MLYLIPVLTIDQSLFIQPFKSLLLTYIQVLLVSFPSMCNKVLQFFIPLFELIWVYCLINRNYLMCSSIY